MAEYSKFILTTKGQSLVAKMLAGSSGVEFTKLCTSSATYTENQLESLMELNNVEQTSLISKVTRTNDVAIKVEGVFTNVELVEGYYMRALGLYALDPNEGEILYGVATETSGNCYLAPYNGVTVATAYIQLYTTVGNADSVSLEVDTGVYATIGDIMELENEIADLRAYVGYSDNDILGVEVDFRNKLFTRLAGATYRTAGGGFDDVNAFGGRRRCNLTDEGVVIAYQGDIGFTTTGKLTSEVIIGDITYEIGTNVQTMVEQPKYYYKVVPLSVEAKAKGFVTRKVRYYVSDEPKAGFSLHPAFIENGSVNDYIYLSAFEGTLWDTSASAYILDDAQVMNTAEDMLCSIANAKPMSGVTQNLYRSATRTLSRNRGGGWEQMTIATTSASQLLALVEYASFDMQSAIGRGSVDKTDDGVTSMTELTGGTVILGNESGIVINGNGITTVAYRGEENLWGNIWSWVDGINVKNPSTFTSGMQTDEIYVADHSFADNIADAPYEATGLYPCYSSGSYINAFCYAEDFDWMLIPGELGGNSALPVGDYLYNTQTGWRVAALGGRWDSSSFAGLFCWTLGCSSAHRGRGIGGRSVYVPSKRLNAE